MRKLLVSLSLCALAQSGCGPGGNGGRGGNGHPTTGKDGGASNNNPGGDDGGFQPPPGCRSTGGDPDVDQDQDGFTPALGDCVDCNPTINPGAIQMVLPVGDGASHRDEGCIAAARAEDRQPDRQAVDCCAG